MPLFHSTVERYSRDSYLGYLPNEGVTFTKVSEKEWDFIRASGLIKKHPGTKIRNYRYGSKSRSHTFIMHNKILYAISNIDYRLIKKADQKQEKINPKDWEDAEEFFEKNSRQYKFECREKLQKKFSYQNEEITLKHSFMVIEITNTEGEKEKVVVALSGRCHKKIGGYGKVKIAMDQKGCFYAIKLFHKFLMHDTSSKEFITTEIELSEIAGFLISHGIKFLYHNDATVNQPFMVMPCFDVDLYAWNRIKNNMTLKDLFLILKLIAEDLKRLHALNILHLDIKPENILLKIDAGNEIIGARLGDFGLSGKMTDGVYMSDARGTPYFLAPEIQCTSNIRCTKYTSKVDIYSLGMTIRSISSNRSSLENDPMLLALAQCMTQSNPEKRPHLDFLVAIIACYANIHAAHVNICENRAYFLYHYAQSFRSVKNTYQLTLFSNVEDDNDCELVNLKIAQSSAVFAICDTYFNNPESLQTICENIKKLLETQLIDSTSTPALSL